MIGSQLVIDLDRVVVVVVPAVLARWVVVEDPGNLGIWNISENVLRDSTDAICRNDVSGERVTQESARSVGPGRGGIVQLDEAPVRILQLRHVSPFERSRWYRANLVGRP